MAGKGKKKRTGADEAENSLGPGLEQPLEEEKTETNINRNQKDKKYHKNVKLISKIREIFCEQPKIINEFEIFLEKLRKSIEESPELKLKVDKAICGEPKITQKFKGKKRIEKSSKNDGMDDLWELLDENTFRRLCRLQMRIRSLAEIGTPSEPPNAAAESSGSPHNEECKFSTLWKLLELVMEFCEKHGMIEEFKAFYKEHEEKVEKQRKFCEALGMVPDNWEDGANQHADKDIQKILKNSSKSEFSRLLQEEKVFKAFCEEHGITEMYQNYREKCKKRTEESSKGTKEQTREFNEEVDKLGEVILDCGTNLLSEQGLQLLIQHYSEDQAATVEEDREMLEGNFKAGPSNVDSNSCGELQSSTTLIIGGVANSSSTGDHGGIGPKLGTPFERAWELKRKGEEELDEARRDKRPATADNYTPPHPPIDGSQPSGFMADARRQTSPQSAAAHLFSTSAWASQWEEMLRKLTGEPALGRNNGARAIMDDFGNLHWRSISDASYPAKQYEELQVKDAIRRKQEQEVLAAASIDANPKFKGKKKEADDLRKQVEVLQEAVSELRSELGKRDEIISNDVSLVRNLMKLLESMGVGTDFLNLSLLDTINHHPPLHQFREGLTSIGQGHTNIDDIFCSSFDSPTVVTGPSVSDQLPQSVNMGSELIGCGRDFHVVPLAAINPRFQTANTGTNNVDQEANIANRENKAAEVDNSGMGADATSGSWYP